MLEDQSDRLREAGKLETENVKEEAGDVLHKSLPPRVLWNWGLPGSLKQMLLVPCPTPPDHPHIPQKLQMPQPSAYSCDLL